MVYMLEMTQIFTFSQGVLCNLSHTLKWHKEGPTQLQLIVKSFSTIEKYLYHSKHTPQKHQ